MFSNKLVVTACMTFFLLFCFAGMTDVFCNEIDETFIKADESGYLELFYNPGSSQIVVRDNRNGHVWRSNPIVDANKFKLAEGTAESLQSTFVMNFTNKDRSTLYKVYSVSPEITFSHTLMESGGVAFTFSMYKKEVDQGTNFVRWEGTIKWQVLFELEEDYLEVFVPEEALSEDGSYTIVTLDVMPWFGANPEREEGFMVFPIGNGAFIPYRNSQPAYMSGLAVPVYGEDDFNFSGVRDVMTDLLPNQMGSFVKRFEKKADTVVAPVYGITAEGDALLCIATAGYASERITCGPAGYIVGFNRIGFKDVYREKQIYPLSRSKTALRYALNPVAGDRERRFYFIQGPGVDLTSITDRYRQYLMEVEGVVRHDGSPAMNIRIFCGISKKSLFGKRIIAATTFSQAQEIIAALIERGITDFSVTLVGWSDGGHYGTAPNKFPPERALGGAAGLKSLVEFAHSNGIPVLLEADYLLAFAGNRGFSIKKDSMKFPLEIPVTDGKGTYLMTPRAAYEKHVKQDVERFLELGVDGVVLRNIGEALLSDWSEKNNVSRQGNADYGIKMLEEFKRSGLQVQTTGWNSYTYPYIDGLQNIPVRSRPMLEAKQEVPFMSISLHGLLPYYSQVLNLSEDLQQDFLRVVEYGFSPSFELTYEDPVVLKDTSYNGLFSSYWKDWLEKIDEIYGKIKSLSAQAEKFIVSHRAVSKDVFVVEYDDGSYVIVNYGDSDFTFRERNVEAEGYLLVESEKEAN
jgi:hypothetical protein